MKTTNTIDFGTIRKYFPDRGYGFVDSVLRGGAEQSVFFHIKAIKASNPDLAREIESRFSDSQVAHDTSGQQCNPVFGASSLTPREPVRLWLEYEHTLKGIQVSTVLDANVVQKAISDENSYLPEKIEDTWIDIQSPLPNWLHDVTVAALGSDRAMELSRAREELEKAQEAIKEKRRIQLEAEKNRLETERREILEARQRQDQIEEDEFDQLVAEVRPRGFRHSKQLSHYIVSNKLGYRYKNISGVLEMEKDGKSFEFDGGFPGHIYARLCNELELINQGSRARPRAFRPYKTLIK